MIRGFWRFLTTLYHRTVRQDDCPTLAASISFYAILSFLPFIILAVSISSFFVASSEAAFARIQEFLVQALPVSTTAALNLVSSTVAQKAVYGIVGLIGLLWGSMRIFTILEQAMGRIWRAPAQRAFWESRMVSLISIPLMAVFLLASIAVTGLISVAKQSAIPILGLSLTELPGVTRLLTSLLPVFLSTMLFLSAYYLLPKRWDHLRNAFWGALLAGVLWETAKLLFDYYIKNFSHLQTIYGSFASLAIVFLWVYYSSFVVLLGAEFGSLLQEYKREPKTTP
ncbi:MAG: YihY/virulence factor BrkB family protein [candidate division Zixibacteria bacterium]|nr:YihY/virulence factor BrkB family protein [candidate division Zixibacteria bacterium]